MILPIYTYGEEILRKKAEDVNLEDEWRWPSRSPDWLK
jgi:peptide deformylase